MEVVMSHRILFVSQVGPPAFPRLQICDTEGRVWDGTAWTTVGLPLLYADKNLISTDCADLQRQETVDKQHRIVVEVPLRAEVFSDQPLDPDELRAWLRGHLSLDIDFTEGTGPTPDSIVMGVIDWPRYRIVGVTA
jgi:hypothetical protein